MREIMTDELLIKFLLDEASEDEKSTVQNWLDQSEANREQFAQLDKIWTISKSLATKSNVNEEQAWVNFKQKAETTVLKKPAVKSLKQSLGWLKIAAILAIITGLWISFSIFGSSGYTDLVAKNEVVLEKLPDGSELTLNKNTELSYATDFKKKRSIKFKNGEVFFKVAPDKSKPFVIEINKVSVTVVGTSFNIKHLKGQTEIIVETGTVRVEFEGQQIELHKGEKTDINQIAAQLIKGQNKDHLYDYYRTRIFTADNIPLSKLIKTLNDAYGSHVEIQNRELASTLITTTLPAGALLEENLKIICQTLDLKIVRNQQQILLSYQE